MDGMIKGVSVVVCCYNSVSRLKPTLQHLSKQKFHSSLNCELILVNNNSTDQTSSFAIELWEGLGNSIIPLKIVDEPKPGLSNAREKGMSMAQYDIVLFCDDDNWLCENYVATVFDAFQRSDTIGAVGGWCEAAFEGKKPDWFDVFSGNFAVGKVKDISGFLDKPNDFIYGAGMSISKKAMANLNQRGFRNILSDRKGKKLSSGGDVEIIRALRLIGYNIYFDDRLFFQHFMPDSRMNWEYLLRIRKSMIWSNFVLGIYVDCIKGVQLTPKNMLTRIGKSIREILKINRKIKSASEYNKLFLSNQKEVRAVFLKNVLFYWATYKKLMRLKND